MPTYYTQNPTGSFEAYSDEDALQMTKAEIVYKESNSYDNTSFTIIRDYRKVTQLCNIPNIAEFYTNCEKLFFIHRKDVKEVDLYYLDYRNKDYYFTQFLNTGYALLSYKSTLLILKQHYFQDSVETYIIELEFETMDSKEIQIQYEKCLEEQKVENENKANLALLREQELIKQSKLIFEEKITKYLKAVESFKLELKDTDIEFFSEYFNQENQYPIFRFMIKIPPVSNKSNKPRVKIVNFNKETNKFEFHIPIGHEKDPFYQQSVIYIDKFKSILSQSKE